MLEDLEDRQGTIGTYMNDLVQSATPSAGGVNLYEKDRPLEVEMRPAQPRVGNLAGGDA